MTLPKFDLLQPAAVAEACVMLEKYSPEGAAVLAGGTDILVNIRRPIIPVHLPRCNGCFTQNRKPFIPPENPLKYLIALSGIKELKGIRQTTDGKIEIGCLTTITEICDSEIIRKNLKALADGAENLGSPLVRNRGTIGGNICNARPAADLLIPAYALSAKLELVCSTGKRIVAIEDFVVGPGKTTINKNEILTKIIFDNPGKFFGSSSVKLANRKALEISIVNAASVLILNEAKDKIEFARIAMGAVGPTPVLAHKAAEFLLGKIPGKDNFTQAGEIASGECRPITDHRGSANYRKDMVKILVKRALEKARKQMMSDE